MATNDTFFNFIELQYDKLSNQINDWLKGLYKKSGINYNSSSPFGQVINVQKELFQWTIIYVKNTINNYNITTSQNTKVIQSISRIAGHTVGRAISATGTLKFKLKSGVDISKEIKDSVVIIKNHLLLKNKSNSLYYSVNLSTDSVMYPIIINGEFYLPIIQGSYEETQKFTGKGVFNQSFSVNVPNAAQIENFNYIIKYNGYILTSKDHMYDMLPNEYAVVVKSGFNGGIDLYFGNGNFGFIPQQGSIIECNYLLSNGSQGEILNPIDNDWKVIGDILDGQQNILSTDKLFDISVFTDINFASDGESIEMTKTIVPYVSRNFVLATPNQFIFHLKRLNLFSKVNAYNKLENSDFGISDSMIDDAARKIRLSVNNNSSSAEVLACIDNFEQLYNRQKNNMTDNTIYLYLIPSIQKYFNDTTNYFNIPFDVFYLDDNEKQKVIQYLRQMGTMSITTEVDVIQPVITRYVMHVYVRRYEYGDENSIKQQIISSASTYLINNNRFDRIPQSDFVQLFKTIDGVDSVSVYFVSKDNEDYHRQATDLGYKTNTNTQLSTFNNQSVLTQPTIIKNGIGIKTPKYDSNIIIGLDPIHDDIIMEQNQYAVIRGGWYDRNKIWYNEDPNSNGLNSINITFDGVTATKLS